MHTKICDGCNKEFFTTYSKKLTCSDLCKSKRKRKLENRPEYSRNVCNGTIGAMSEMLASIDLFSKGFVVFRALSPSCFCDLIAIKENIIYKVEVRTGFRNKSTNKLQFPKTISPQANIFAVFNRTDNKIVYLESLGNKEIEI